MMERIQRDFLWTGTKDQKRYPLVAWEKVCLPKKLGGLGIRNLKHLNSALQAKQLWRIFSSQGDWRDIMIEKYIRQPSLRYLLSEIQLPQGSVIWNGLLKARNLARSKVKWKVGNGKDILFWHDHWLFQGPLSENPIYGRWVEICIMQYEDKFCNYRSNQGWKDLSLISGDLSPVKRMLNSMTMNDKKDEIVWADNHSGNYSVASGYMALMNSDTSPVWAKAWYA
jgi:hypothetical protein